MTIKLKNLVILFCVVVLFNVACGKPEHNNNQINRAQQQSSSQQN